MATLAIQIRAPRGQRTPGELAIAEDFAVEGPLVSCLMVSRGRCFPAAHAIAAFQRQTYRNRELVIVCAEPEPELPALIEELDDPRIRFLTVPPATMGELRNRTVAHAAGELLCHWDDDDLYSDDRIAIQAATLAADRVQACFLDCETLWAPAAERFALSRIRIWENSMLIWRAAQPIYPATDTGEDTQLAQMVIDRHHVALLRAPHAYCYVRHGANLTSTAHAKWLFDTSTPGSAGWETSEALASYAAGARSGTRGRADR